jgi:hypothetical protein
MTKDFIDWLASLEPWQVCLLAIGAALAVAVPIALLS